MTDDGGRTPIQIRAQALRQAQECGHSGAMADFALGPDPGKAEACGAETRRKAGWRQTDVKRAIGAAEQAGLRHYRVEIAPDGTISIIVGDSTPPA